MNTTDAISLPAAQPAANSTLGQRLGRWYVISAGVILALTGLAKVHSTLFSQVKMLTVLDPILGITFGNLMLLVGLAELAIAYVCLFKGRPGLSAALIAWISLNFLVYRLGLWWIGWKKPCGCLGNLTDALGITPQTADRIALVLLAYLLIGSGLVLLWNWRKQRANDRKAGSSAASACAKTQRGTRFPGFFVLFWFFITSQLSSLAAIVVQGEYHYQAFRKGAAVVSRDDREFHAVFDDQAIVITSITPSLQSQGPCTNVVIASKDILATVLHCADSEPKYVTFAPPEFSWELGNCSDGLSSWVFLMLRNEVLFPVTSGSGIRRLVSPMELVGEPLAQVTQAEYAESPAETKGGTTLKCEILVSETLLNNWRESPFLSAKLDETELTQAQSHLRQYRPGFLRERIFFSHFTNAGHSRFPTLLESEIFSPDVVSSTTGRLFGKVLVKVNSVQHDPDHVVSILPLRGALFSIRERRLRDPKTHVAGVNYYHTNQITAFEISPAAHAAFSVERNRGHREVALRRLKKVLAAVIITLSLAGPLIIFHLCRRPKIDARVYET